MPSVELHSIPEALAWLAAQGVQGLATDSRRIQPGDAFIAWPGLAVDGRRFVGHALEAGAVACLMERQGAEEFEHATHPAVACMSELKLHTGELVDAFWKHPSQALSVLAVTGTNGKTSTAWWLAQALGSLGRRCAVVGTLGIGLPPNDLVANGLTTPDPVTLHGALHRFKTQGFTACAIEASSIGISEHRLQGVSIQVALFTNLTQDHLDYHGDMQHYQAAKARLFSWPGLQAAVINLDDPVGPELARHLPKGVAAWTYSCQDSPNGNARLIAVRGPFTQGGGLGFEVIEQGGATARVDSTLVGEFNIANLLGVVGGLRSMGVPLAQAAAACSALTPVPGRLQRVQLPHAVPGPAVIVDYAHTPDALQKVLRALRPWAQAQGGALWCVFGCGGNRDASKRPLMGAQAQSGADKVVLTSDNPRYENAQQILQQIKVGMTSEPTVIEDRTQAIAYAVGQAHCNDVILLAGKGHEDYQEIAGIRRPFSDVAQALAALELKETAA